jgi:hypothetical protein
MRHRAVITFLFFCTFALGQIGANSQKKADEAPAIVRVTGNSERIRTRQMTAEHEYQPELSGLQGAVDEAPRRPVSRIDIFNTDKSTAPVEWFEVARLLGWD